MPKSRHRKDQKKKSKARTQRVHSQQAALRKKMEEEFLKELEEIKNKKEDGAPLGKKDISKKSKDVTFEEVKK